nr:response regulator [FCB group bacterium]
MEKKLDKVRLLLVDDEEDFLASASSALERRNIEVIIADNGREALEICDKQSFDVVVLDVKMPGIDGVELFRRIKAKIPG